MLIAFMELKNIKKEISTLNVANKDKKKQCHVDTARNKSPAITGMEQQGSGRGSCSTPIRTMTERTKNSSATITPWNIH